MPITSSLSKKQLTGSSVAMVNVSKKKVFLIDPELTICEQVRETLEDSNIELSCFSNPIECLAQLRTIKCDLLITGLKIPIKDGIEILMDVKHRFPWIPVMIITKHGNIPSAVKAMKSGAEDFIEKPFDNHSFARKIKSILKNTVFTSPKLGDPLTQQEINILQLIIAGNSNKDISIMLHRSICTIELHRANIMNKLGVKNKVDLVKRVISMELVSLKDKS